MKFVHFRPYYTASVCSHSDVRWIKVYSNQYGTAQVCINGLWANMCSSGSDTTAVAQIFCRQLMGQQSRKNDVMKIY